MSQVPFEVFVKSTKANTYEHVGSVRAPNPGFALEWAQASYARRMEATDVWVVPRQCITSMRSDAQLSPSRRKDYAQPGFFTRRRSELLAKLEENGGRPAQAGVGGEADDGQV